MMLNTTDIKKPLIISYSYSGNTHKIARAIQNITGGDRSEIYPWQPYPAAFPELLRQVKKEIAEHCYPPLLPVSHSPRKYSVVFVGSPNWCGSISPPLASWLHKNNLSGKIIIPFYSHCGGVAGDIKNDIAKLCPRADVRDALGVIDDGGEDLTQLLYQWFVKIGATELALTIRAVNI